MAFDQDPHFNSWDAKSLWCILITSCIKSPMISPNDGNTLYPTSKYFRALHFSRLGTAENGIGKKSEKAQALLTLLNDFGVVEKLRFRAFQRHQNHPNP